MLASVLFLCWIHRIEASVLQVEPALSSFFHSVTFTHYNEVFPERNGPLIHNNKVVPYS